MRYADKTFTVAPSGSYEQAHAVCKSHGHMEPDKRGKCLRCGEKCGGVEARALPDGGYECRTID